MRTNLWWLAGILAIAPAIGHETSEDLGTKIAGEHLKAEGSLPPGGVADSGSAVNQGGFIWTRENFLKYNSLVREKDSIGKHTSVFAGKWHYSGGAGEAKLLDWKHTAETEVADRKVVVNWRVHPGAKIVLNNGNCHDTFWGDEQGKWPFFHPTGEWLHFWNEKQIAKESVWAYGDDYNLKSENTTQIGNHKVTLTYHLDDGRICSGNYFFEVVPEIKVRQIRSQRASAGKLPLLAKENVFTFRANTKEQVSGTVTTTVTAKWSESFAQTTTKGVSADIGVNHAIKAEFDAFVASVEGEFDISIRGKILGSMAKEHKIEIGGERTINKGFTIGPKIVKKGYVYNVYVSLDYTKYDFECEYYFGFPDGTRQTISFSIIVPQDNLIYENEIKKFPSNKSL